MTAPQGARDDAAGMGLLSYLTAHAIDDDYAEVARRRRLAGERHRSPAGRLLALLVIALLGALVVVAAGQTSQDADRPRAKAELIAQARQQRATLDSQTARIHRLTAQNSALRGRLLHSGRLSGGLRERLGRLSRATGTTAVSGPGVLATVDDAPGARDDQHRVLDSDLQRLVNALWQSGARAVTVNGQRLTAQSAIRQAGSAITVNYRSLEHPYRVQALGDPGTLPTRFAGTGDGQAWLDLQQQVGLRFDLVSREQLHLAAAPAPTLRYAHTGGS